MRSRSRDCITSATRSAKEREAWRLPWEPSLRPCRAAVFAAEKLVVAAGEGDRGRAEPSGHGQARAARDHLARCRSDPDDDAGGGGAEGIEVVLVGIAGHDVLPDERVVPGAGWSA
jgi:hypothetical protein